MSGRPAVVCFLMLLAAAGALADGGTVRARQDAGPFSVAVFTSPEPLAAGPADISVLVQDRESGEVILDADVFLELSGPGATRSSATRAGANRLLQSAVVDLRPAGAWDLAVTVRRGEASARLSCRLLVAPPASRLSAVWPLLAVPPLGIALFALRRTVRVRRARPAVSR